jgi:hypothetical protein
MTLLATPLRAQNATTRSDHNRMFRRKIGGAWYLIEQLRYLAKGFGLGPLTAKVLAMSPNVFWPIVWISMIAGAFLLKGCIFGFPS